MFQLEKGTLNYGVKKTMNTKISTIYNCGNSI